MIIARITTRLDFPDVLRGKEVFLIKEPTDQFPEGFAGYLCFHRPVCDVPCNTFLIDEDFRYLNDGDVVRIQNEGKGIRVMYRRSSLNNTFLLTERCNNLCLMCSQPPKKADDSYIVDHVLRVIPLIAVDTKMIGLTGGETTLLGDDLVKIIRSCKGYLPNTGLHVLSNGRAFKDLHVANEIGAIKHSDLMFGIPLYSENASIHDYVVQAKGAFDETIRGLINLKACGVKIELRIVLHKITTQRLVELAEFITRNLVFCDQVALMGLEMTGFTKHNLDLLWQDPFDYRAELRNAVEVLQRANMKALIFNHQLCVLDKRLHSISCKSISDWKNIYYSECAGCVKKSECGGFFASSTIRRSQHIKAFTEV